MPQAPTASLIVAHPGRPRRRRHGRGRHRTDGTLAPGGAHRRHFRDAADAGADASLALVLALWVVPTAGSTGGFSPSGARLPGVASWSRSRCRPRYDDLPKQAKDIDGVLTVRSLALRLLSIFCFFMFIGAIWAFLEPLGAQYGIDGQTVGADRLGQPRRAGRGRDRRRPGSRRASTTASRICGASASSPSLLPRFSASGPDACHVLGRRPGHRLHLAVRHSLPDPAWRSPPTRRAAPRFWCRPRNLLGPALGPGRGVAVHRRRRCRPGAGIRRRQRRCQPRRCSACSSPRPRRRAAA